MSMPQAELSQRFYKKQKLQKIAADIWEEWERNPNPHRHSNEVHNQIRAICNLPRGWQETDYEKALQSLEKLRQELHSRPVAVSTIPKLTELLTAALNIIAAGTRDKCSALTEAFYRTNGFNGLEELSLYLQNIIKQEKERQSFMTGVEGFYNPGQIPTANDDRTKIPKNTFHL